MTEATPRPWILESDMGTDDWFVHGADYEPIAAFAEQKANAELIVTAVNAHAPMLKALKAVEWTGRDGYTNLETGKCVIHNCCPNCNQQAAIGHLDDCYLAAAIALGKGAG